MQKNAFYAILILAVLVGMAYSASSQETNEEVVKEVTFDDKGRAFLEGPATVNGVLVSPASGTTFALIIKSKDGYSISNEINIHDINIKNIEKGKIEEDSISGVAGRDSIVANTHLSEGTKFRYDKVAGKVIVEQGGSFYSDTSDGRLLVVAKKGEFNLPNSGDMDYVELNPDSSIEINKQISGTFDYSTTSKYEINSLGYTKVSRLDEEIIKIEGDAVLFPTERFDHYYSYPDFVPTKDFAELHGTTEVLINPETNRLEGLIFGNDGTSYYRKEMDKPSEYGKKVSGEFGPLLLTYTNKIDGIEGEFNANSGVFFKEPSPHETKGLDGFAEVKTIETAELINARGMVTIYAKNSEAEKIGYSGLDKYTDTNIMIENEFLTGDITHPKLGYTTSTNEIASVNYGGITSYYSIKDGKFTQLSPTKTLFSEQEDLSITDIIVQAPVISGEFVNGRFVSGDSYNGGIFGFAANLPITPEGVTYMYPKIDLASQDELKQVVEKFKKFDWMERFMTTQGSIALGEIGGAQGSKFGGRIGAIVGEGLGGPLGGIAGFEAGRELGRIVGQTCATNIVCASFSWLHDVKEEGSTKRMEERIIKANAQRATFEMLKDEMK